MSETEVEVVPDEDEEIGESLEGMDGEPGEGGDDDAEPELSAEPEPPEPAPGDEEQRERFDKIQRSFATFTRRVSELYAEEAQSFLRCPLCPDDHPGFVDTRFAGRVPVEVRDAAQMYLGIAREQDYERATHVGMCAMCAGKGKVASGSAVAGHETVTCPNCKGYGYSPPPGAPQNGPTQTPVEPQSIAADVPAPPQRDVDVWGEPRILPDGRENPNYGRMPDMKIQVEPYGVTAGLTALDVA